MELILKACQMQFLLVPVYIWLGDSVVSVTIVITILQSYINDQFQIIILFQPI